MKKAVIVITAIGLMVGLGVAVNNHYESYQDEQKSKQVSAQEVTVAETSKLATKLLQTEASLTESTKQYNELHAECEKGLVAYNALAPYLQAQTPVPSCGEKV